MSRDFTRIAFRGDFDEVRLNFGAGGVMRIAWVGTLLAMCACGGGSSGISTASSDMTKVLGQSSVGDCPNGGVVLGHGIDRNRNGELDDAEINGTTVICHGSDGAPGTDGTSCTAVDNGDGTKTISCSDGTSVMISDGADGSVGPSIQLTVGSGLSGDGTSKSPLGVDFTSVAATAHRHGWADLDNIPSDIADGDDGIITELDPNVNTLGKAPISCGEAEIAKMLSGNWQCVVDDVLSEADVDTFVADNGYALSSATDPVAAEVSGARLGEATLGDAMMALDNRVALVESHPRWVWVDAAGTEAPEIQPTATPKSGGEPRVPYVDIDTGQIWDIDVSTSTISRRGASYQPTYESADCTGLGYYVVSGILEPPRVVFRDSSINNEERVRMDTAQQFSISACSTLEPNGSCSGPWLRCDDRVPRVGNRPGWSHAGLTIRATIAIGAALKR